MDKHVNVQVLSSNKFISQVYCCLFFKIQGVVKVGAVNADDHKGLGGQYGVQGFPTIKIFGADKFKPTDYQGMHEY